MPSIRAISEIDIAASVSAPPIFCFYFGAFASFFVGNAGARTFFDRNPVDAAAIGFCCLFSNTILLGLRCKRADDIWENAAIIQDVVALIDRSRVVICDCTGRNPNVFSEAGIAHFLGREMILITQNKDDIPFDLRHLRYTQYLNNNEGLKGLASALQERMQTIIGH